MEVLLPKVIWALHCQISTQLKYGYENSVQATITKVVFSLLTTTYFMLSDFQTLSNPKVFNPNMNPNSCSEFPDDIVQDSFPSCFQH